MLVYKYIIVKLSELPGNDGLENYLLFPLRDRELHFREISSGMLLEFDSGEPLLR